MEPALSVSVGSFKMFVVLWCSLLGKIFSTYFFANFPITTIHAEFSAGAWYCSVLSNSRLIICSQSDWGDNFY